MATDFRMAYEQRFGVVEGWLKLYDAKGNVIYCDNSDGSWEKYEYDDQGNVIYCDNSDGSWVKWEYDAQGNEIYCEDSDNRWVKWEYDAQGNEIYHESSSSGISVDKRNNLEGKIATIDGKEYQLTKVK